MIPIETDQVVKGKDRLIYDLQIKENMVKLLTLFLNQVQEVEEANFSTMTERGIFEAIGFQLDLIGKIVGLDRAGMSDDTYRSALLLKVGINNSDGTPNIIIELVKQFTGSSSVEIREGTVAFGNLTLTGVGVYDATLNTLVDQIKPTATLWVIHTDYYNNAFRPAFETSLGESESFQVVISVAGQYYTFDGVNDYINIDTFSSPDTPPNPPVDNFQVTNDGISYEDLFTVISGINFYEPSTGREFLYWEDPETFQVTSDGLSYEDFEVNSPTSSYSEMRVVAPYTDQYVPDNVITLSWEVNEVSKPITA